MTEINEIREQIRKEYFEQNEVFNDIGHFAKYAQWLESKLAALILETSKNITNAKTNTPKPVPA
jgi:hypothetical protein